VAAIIVGEGFGQGQFKKEIARPPRTRSHQKIQGLSTEVISEWNNQLLAEKGFLNPLPIK